MLSVEDTKRVINQHTPSPVIEEVFVPCSRSYNCAEDVHSSLNFPNKPLSMRDGYGWNTKWRFDKKLTLKNLILTPGEMVNLELQEYETCYITTGGFVPHIFDTVVMMEDVTVVNGVVTLKEEVKTYKTGQYIRKVGSDVHQGELLVKKGEDITSVIIAILESCRVKKIKCYKKPIVLYFSNGNELVSIMSEESEDMDKIIDTNSSMLINLLQDDKVVDYVSDKLIVKDSLSDIEAILNDQLSDVIISSGGSSVGQFDLIKSALIRTGYEILVTKVAMMPGKPFIFAKKAQKWFFGLPGNPVASFVCYQIFVKPFLRKMSGYGVEEVNKKFTLEYDTKSSAFDGRMEFQRVFVDEKNYAHSTGDQASSRMMSLREANALIKIYSGKSYPKGTQVEGFLL